MEGKLIYEEKYWKFAREVLLEIKRQQKQSLENYPKGNGIAYNVGLLLDKDICIEDLGKY